MKMWQKGLLLPLISRRGVISRNVIRTFVLTSKRDLNPKWRRERGLPFNPTSSGVLTDTPDFTFLDGRPTPYGVGQKERILKQRELTEQIVQLTAEMDFALDRYNRMEQEKSDRRKQIIDSKLKPKGQKLLESGKS